MRGLIFFLPCGALAAIDSIERVVRDEKVGYHLVEEAGRVALARSSTPESPFTHLEIESGRLAGNLAAKLVGGIDEESLTRGLGHHLRSQSRIQTLTGHLREHTPLPHGAMQAGTQQILGVGLVIHKTQPGQPVDHLIDHVRVEPLVDQTTGQRPAGTGRRIKQGQCSLPASIRIISICSRSCRC